MRRFAALVVATLMFLVLTTPLAAALLSRRTTYYCDAGFTNVVGQVFVPGAECEEQYSSWGTTGAYVRLEFFYECDIPESELCGEIVNGNWVPMTCPN